MRITVSMPSTGLFYAPGLARPIVIEVDQLPKEVAEKLSGLAERARIFDQPETVELGESKNVRDAQQFTITVEHGDKRRTIQLFEPLTAIPNEALREFIQLVREQARLARGQPKSD